ARAAATIQSKHAIQIYDHGVTDDGRPYMVMELLLGEPLDKRIERLGTLPLRETARIIGHVCRALQRAHDAGIIHRDLKPENIFLVRTPDDDDEIAKVLDFGIAKATGNEVSGSNTKTGAMLGTPYYMSPEQAQGVKAVDHRSDLWSLGVIVFQAITGRLPFESEALGDLLVRIIVAPVPRAADFVNDLPPGFEQWWAKASQRDPALRFQSSKEFCESLAASFGQGAAHWGADGNLAPAAPMGGPGQFGITPQPFGMTPQPLGLTPQPFGATGQPVAVTPQPYGATGMPGQAVTQGGVPGLPAPKKTGMLIGIGVGAAAAVILAVVGFSMSGKKSADTAPSAAAPPPPTTLVSAAPVPPTPPVPPPEATHETLA
ncbi:MAG: serine/threonine-protein kinase, partial [Gemmatimonadales bacterium]